MKEFVESLNAAGVRFLVVGGYAVVFHGFPRFTGDLDIFIELSPENASRMERAILNFGFAGLGLNAKAFLDPNHVVQLGVRPHRIDIMGEIEAVTFAEAWEARVAGRLGGVPTYYLSKNHLMLNKAAVARPLDAADLDFLRKL